MDHRQERKDLVFRRRTWRVLGIIAVLGVLGLLGFDAWLRHLTESGPAEPARALRLMALTGALINGAIAVLALLLGRFLLDWARQCRDQRQWPPAGLQTFDNRPPRHGAEAEAIASRLRLAGFASFALAAGVLGWTAWRLLG